MIKAQEQEVSPLWKKQLEEGRTYRLVGTFLGPKGYEFLTNSVNSSGLFVRLEEGKEIVDYFPQYIHRLKEISVDGIHGQFGPNRGGWAQGTPISEQPRMVVQDEEGKLELVIDGYETFRDEMGHPASLISIRSTEAERAKTILKEYFDKTEFKIK